MLEKEHDSCRAIMIIFFNVFFFFFNKIIFMYNFYLYKSTFFSILQKYD